MKADGVGWLCVPAHVGMPFHWGDRGRVTGDAANELTAFVADPNVSIHEGKAFVCNLEKA